jgi:hypothetical protein
MTKNLLFVCGLSLLSWGAARADAQTVAAGPYYATPSWDQKLACSAPANCPRFVLLSNWNSEAVLDRETGLVWQRQPWDGSRTFDSASSLCSLTRNGERQGWRLPAPHELQSLIDTTVGNPNNQILALPLGHPFLGVTIGPYWTGTTFVQDASVAYAIILVTGAALGTFNKADSARVWCVRGGSPIGVQ